jgi:hypothetical protein
MREFLGRIGGNEEGGVTTHVKPPGRESRQDIADLDNKMGIFSREITLIREQAAGKDEPQTLAWYPFIQRALDFTNKKRIHRGRAMGIAPDRAEASFAAVKGDGPPSAEQVTGFVLQARAAEDREHNRKVQNKAHAALADPKNAAFRARIPQRATQGREYRKRDPKWTDKVYQMDTAAGEGGSQGGQVMTKLPAAKHRPAQLMAFKATKVQAVPKNSKDSKFTNLATFKVVSKYEDAREALRPWAVYVVQYHETQPGQMGRVRAIDRDLKLHKGAALAALAEFLPKARLPLALDEVFPEFLQVEN